MLSLAVSIEWVPLALGDRLAERKGVAAQQVEVGVAKRREPRHVGREDGLASRPEVLQGTLHVHRVPNDDCVDHQPEGGELVFLPLAVALSQLASLAVEHHPRQPMSAFATIELGQNPPAIRLVVQVVQQEQGLDHPPELLQGTGELGRLRAALEHAHQRLAVAGAQRQRAGDAQQVVPVLDDALRPDAVGGQVVEPAVVGVTIDAPEARATDVADARAELVAQQPEQAEDHVSIGAGVGHDLARVQRGLLIEQDAEQHKRVAQRAGHDHAVEPAVLVGGEVVEGDATLGAEVFGVGRGVNRPEGHDKAHAVGRGDLAAAPVLAQLQSAVGLDQAGVGAEQGVAAQGVLLHPA